MNINPVVALLAAGEVFGGVERHLLGMCTWLRRRGVEPLLVLFNDGELARQARDEGFAPVILPCRGSFDVTSPRRLATLLAQRQVTVVHAHGYRAVVTAALARSTCRFRLVRTVHGLLEPEARYSLDWLKSHTYVWLEERASRWAKAKVCCVTDELRVHRAGRGSDRGECTVRNGIDPLPAVAAPRPADLRPGRFYFAAVGRVSPIKGLDTALKAMASPDFPPAADLAVIGTGPSVGALQSLVAELGLGARVRFLGFKQDIAAYLAHVDALVMPSGHEGLPYTVLEAMSLGTPIIASRVGGLAEVLVDGVTATLVAPGNVAEWVNAMSRHVQDPGFAARCAQAARAEQARSYDLETMGAAYWRIYTAGE